MSIEHDYDSKIDFSRYQSFRWLGNDAVESAETGPGPLFAQRVRQYTETELSNKGVRIVTDAAPDMLIAFHAGTEDVDAINTEQQGYAYGRWAYTDVSVQDYTEGTLILDLIDAGSNELVWRGWATATVDPNASQDSRNKKLQEAVKRILENYPPRR